MRRFLSGCILIFMWIGDGRWGIAGGKAVLDSLIEGFVFFVLGLALYWLWTLAALGF